MQGQARPGDTLGVWTYNETLNAGQFPLQTWTKDAGKHISAAVLGHLGEQKLSRQPRFECVASALQPIVNDSPFITVVIICSGIDAIKGTSFDKEINRAFAQWRDEQQKAHMPLVVVLRAARGEYTHYTVTPAPWKAEMPPLPAELVAAREAARKQVAAKPQTSSVPPLIISGKRSEP